MAAQRLSGLQRRMLQWVYDVEASRDWLYRPGYGELRQALGGNKGNMSVSLRNLEAKGLINVYRTSGGQTSTVWLTEAGKNRTQVFKSRSDRDSRGRRQPTAGMTAIPDVRCSVPGIGVHRPW